jgi:hypothetical protein
VTQRPLASIHSPARTSGLKDVLDVYHRPYDKKRPAVCLDATFKQLFGETSEPLPVRPGDMERYDSVYVRNGVASVRREDRQGGDNAHAPPARLCGVAQHLRAAWRRRRSWG